MNEMANANMIEFWNGDASQKWVRFQDIMEVSLLPFGHEAMAAGRIGADDSVLDIGCGCGDTSFELARRVGPGGRVFGVDISEPMLARAQARAARGTDQNLTFARADAQTHAFDEATFDIVFSRFGVMFFDDPVAAFGNLKSALKPGGRLAFACWLPGKDNEWVRLPLGVVAKHVPLPTPPGPEDPGEFAFGDADRVRRILSDSGFADIAIEKKEMPISLGQGLEDTVAFFMQMGPTSGALNEAEADEAARSRVTADLHAALQPFESAQGVVMNTAVWIVTAHKP